MIICGTGHRPDKLGGYSFEVYSRVVDVAKEWMEKNLSSNALVISGGALGWDQALADAAFALELDVSLYLPFPGFEDRWPSSSRKTLYNQIYQCRSYQFISEGPYAGYKMQLRNEAMVNASDLVLALWNGTSGGTANCIAYANKVGKPIVNLWDRYEQQTLEH